MIRHKVSIQQKKELQDDFYSCSSFCIFKEKKMSTKYKATTTEEAYFITITTVGWIDIFTRLNQKYNIVNALQYCQEQKGLEIYAYCIMHSPPLSEEFFKSVYAPQMSLTLRFLKVLKSCGDDKSPRSPKSSSKTCGLRKCL
jgi:hypothetical protein